MVLNKKYDSINNLLIYIYGFIIPSILHFFSKHLLNMILNKIYDNLIKNLLEKSYIILDLRFL